METYQLPAKQNRTAFAPIAKARADLVAVRPFGAHSIQRKASCACGGGCPRCQAKSSNLKVSQPNDAAEIEADQMADKVMRMPDVGNAKPKSNSITTTPMMHPKFSASRGVTSVGGGIGEQINASRGSGSGLDRNTRSFMESRFGIDLSRVQIHTDSQAAKMSRDLNANAFTVGGDIYFKDGLYQPNSESGKHLLAHELSHVVQQRGQTGAIGLQIQRQDDGTTATAADEVCAALRTQLENSGRVIALYHEFLAGNVTWEEMQSQIRMVGNAAQGVTGAGLDLPQVVQDAIAEVESLGLEEIQQGGALLWELIAGDTESFHTQWVRNEIERQQHLNLVLIEAMYSHGCPDFPGTWEGYQEQVLSIATRGSARIQQPWSTSGQVVETRTAVAWVSIGEEEVLVLATEVAGSGRLRFVRWIDSEFRDLSIEQAEEKQGSIPAVPSTAVSGLPPSVPDSAARR